MDFIRKLTLPQKCFVINIAMYNNARKSQSTFVLYRLISFSKPTLVLYLYCTMLKCCTVKNMIGKKQAQCGHKNDRKSVCFSSITKILEGNLEFYLQSLAQDLKHIKILLFIFWSIKFSFSVFVMI